MKPGSACLSYDLRAVLLALAAGLPGTVIALVLVWNHELSPKGAWSLTVLMLGFWLGLSLLLRAHVTRPLRTMSNLLAALREGDFSVRGRLTAGSDALGTAVAEINALGETLRSQRLDAIEATALLTKVMEEIDVALFAFDEGRRLRLLNRSAEALLERDSARARGCTAEQLGMGELLEGESPRTIETAFPSGAGQWELRRGTFRQGGMPHTLVVLTNLERALREEERQAWQRLVRVLGHEINNSLAPIRSLAVSLEDVLARRPADWEEDLNRGLAIISRRSDALNRFMSSYAKLARLPPPTFEPVDVGTWVRRVAELEKRLDVEVVPGPDVVVRADPDQLDQVLINLIQNGVDAASERGGGVKVQWQKNGTSLEVRVIDEGPGISETANLFVPFFTTKPHGSGIGLVLSRQIAEAHRGKLTLEERRDGSSGCVARLAIPLGLPIPEERPGSL